MAQTGRQAVVEHFSKQEKPYPQPVDLALDMRAVQITNRDLKNKVERDYIKTSLDAGYKSPVFEELHKDVVAAQKSAPKKSDEKK